MDPWTKDKLPQGDWSRAQQTRVVSFLRLDGPFCVRSANGLQSTADGYLFLDSRGFPYVVDVAEFETSYQEGAPVPIVPPVEDPPEPTTADEPENKEAQPYRRGRYFGR